MKTYLNPLFLILLLLITSSYVNASVSLAQKEKKIYPMGKKIFHKKCDSKMDLQKYESIEELAHDIKDKKLCKPLKQKQFDALCLYLFEVKRLEDTNEVSKKIIISKDDKCPICGMYVYKYPKWISQIYYNEKYFSFDGVKDMMKYYFEYREGITEMLVRDYYSLKVLDARDAYFVVGSDVYGPMGNEFISFEKENEAKAFSIDHKGMNVMKFEDINIEEVNKIDE
ncbi:nitrous oxide reductase accessory protein NosL [Sulfurimonas sp.]|uniref:nitrous oxide reductase accessory protein NosL n=1 Tax=Sulfurimonas sp. TaxID=2022749 RepID=UPI002B4A989B|nr:nitrous oxide reductase accessory protein NosL [Sulfurimonas sp.]